MAVDDLGPKGQPLFDGSKRSNTAADQSAISNYAGKVGNRVVCTAAQMAAFNSRFGFDPWDGLECFQSDTGDTFIFDASSNGWNAAFQSGPSGGGLFTPSSGFAMSSGGNTGSQTATVGINGVQVYASFFRTGSDITPNADGNIGSDVIVGRLSVHPLQDSGLGSGRLGRMASYIVAADGYVHLTATTNSQAIETGDGLSLAGFYLSN